MDDAPAVGILDGLAGVNDLCHQTTEAELRLSRIVGLAMVVFDCHLQIHTAYESHGVVRPAIGKLPQAVDGHDAGMLESTGDLRFAYEASPVLIVVGMSGKDFFEGDLAMQFFVESNRNSAESAPLVQTKDGKPAALGNDSPRGESCGCRRDRRLGGVASVSYGVSIDCRTSVSGSSSSFARTASKASIDCRLWRGSSLLRSKCFWTTLSISFDSSSLILP